MLTKGHTFSTGDEVTAAKLNALVDSATLTGGTATLTSALIIEAQNFTFNDLGAALDFRVEGDTDQYLLMCDGSSDRVGIGVQTPAATLHVYADSTDNDVGVEIENAGTGNTLLLDVNGNAISLNIDSEATTANILQIDADALTSGNGLVINSSSADNTERYLLDIQNTGGGTSATSLRINQDSNTYALTIDGEQTTSPVLFIAADALTSGEAIAISSDHDDATARNLIEVINEHAGATATTGLFIRQDAANESIFLDQNGATHAIEIDMADANAPIFKFTSNVGDNGTENPTTDAPADWIEVLVGATTYFIPLYT